MRMVGYYRPRGDDGDGAKHFKKKFDAVDQFYLPLPGDQALPLGTRATFSEGFEVGTFQKMTMTFEVVGHRWYDKHPNVLVHDLRACDVAGLADPDCANEVVNWLRRRHRPLGTLSDM